MYGAGFVTQFGEKPPRIWIEELGQISVRDIENGLRQCKRTASNFAPSLPQFLAYCQPVEMEDVKKKERETYQRLGLPKPESNPEIRRAEIAKMKAELRIRGVST